MSSTLLTFYDYFFIAGKRLPKTRSDHVQDQAGHCTAARNGGSRTVLSVEILVWIMTACRAVLPKSRHKKRTPFRSPYFASLSLLT